MKNKVIVLLLFALVILGVSLIRTASKAPPQKKMVPNKNRIAWYVEDAKSEGRKRATMSAGIGDYLGSADQDIDKAISQYTILVAEPIESKTYQGDSESLVTWYRFRTVESLTDTKLPPCLACNTLSVPQEMLPINADEFFVPRAGGTMEIDGIEVTEIEASFPAFERGQRYLMFLLVYPSGVALTAGGPLGVFRVVNHDTLRPLDKEPYGLKKEMETKLGSSLARLRLRARSSR